MARLESCPFCGGKAKAYVKDYGDTHYWRVSCSSDRCGVNPVTNVYHTEAGAIAAWNSRAERVTVYPNGEQGITVCGKTYVPERTCKNNAPSYLDFLCSECGFVHYHSEANDTGEGNEWNYCPNCGAKVIEQ